MYLMLIYNFVVECYQQGHVGEYVHSWMLLNTIYNIIWFSFTGQNRQNQCQWEILNSMHSNLSWSTYLPNDGFNYCNKAIEVQFVLYAADVLSFTIPSLIFTSATSVVISVYARAGYKYCYKCVHKHSGIGNHKAVSFKET